MIMRRGTRRKSSRRTRICEISLGSSAFHMSMPEPTSQVTAAIWTPCASAAVVCAPPWRGLWFSTSLRALPRLCCGQKNQRLRLMVRGTVPVCIQAQRSLISDMAAPPQQRGITIAPHLTYGLSGGAWCVLVNEMPRLGHRKLWKMHSFSFLLTKIMHLARNLA